MWLHWTLFAFHFNFTHCKTAQTVHLWVSIFQSSAASLFRSSLLSLLLLLFHSILLFHFFFHFNHKNPVRFYLSMLFLTAFYRSSFMYCSLCKQLLLDYVRNDLRTCCKLKFFTENRKFQFLWCACFGNLRNQKRATPKKWKRFAMIEKFSKGGEWDASHTHTV